MPDPHLPKSVQHRCHPDGECFCVYDPECNPNAKATRLIPAEVTDEMVERGARALEHWADAWGQPARREAAARAVLVAALSTTRVEGDA